MQYKETVLTVRRHLVLQMNVSETRRQIEKTSSEYFGLYLNIEQFSTFLNMCYKTLQIWTVSILFSSCTIMCEYVTTLGSCCICFRDNIYLKTGYTICAFMYKNISVVCIRSERTMQRLYGTQVNSWRNSISWHDEPPVWQDQRNRSVKTHTHRDITKQIHAAKVLFKNNFTRFKFN